MVVKSQVYQGKRELIPSTNLQHARTITSISGKTRIDPQQKLEDARKTAKYIRENENWSPAGQIHALTSPQVYQGKRELIPSFSGISRLAEPSISGKTRIDPQPWVLPFVSRGKYIRENENWSPASETRGQGNQQVYQGKRELIPSLLSWCYRAFPSISGKTGTDPQPASLVAW